MDPVPLTPARLVAALADLVVAVGGRALRVAVDGAPAAAPSGLADALALAVRERGRPAVRTRAGDFLRPASVRYERGRQDSGAYRHGWLDVGGLRRELLDPWGPEGSRRYLPRLWDAELDRAARADYQTVPPGAVLLVDGVFLLERGLPFDLTIHMRLSTAALRRRTPEGERWTLPAYDDYPGDRSAQVVVRADDPARPALEVR